MGMGNLSLDGEASLQMKKHLPCIALALSCALGTIAAVKSANITDSGAILTEVHNQVSKRSFVDWTRHIWGEPCQGKLGDLLPEGTQLGTGDRSWAQISWPRITTRIWEDSVVAIAPNKKIVYLLNGEMLFILDKNHKVSENIEIWTKLLQARVHGTTILVQSTSDFCRVAVLEGNLDVTNRLDNSVVHLEPGVVYEVRTGAPPPPTWLPQDGLNFDILKKSLLPARQDQNGPSRQPPWPNYVANYNSAGYYNPYTPPKYEQSSSSEPPAKKYSEAQIEAKANELSHGDPVKKQKYLEYLRKINPDVSSNEHGANGTQNWQQTRHSDAEIEAKAEEYSHGNPQLKRELLEKLHCMNGDPPGSCKDNMTAPANSRQEAPQADKNFFPSLSSAPASFNPITPVADTSEFAPMRKAKYMPDLTKKSVFVDDVSSHAVPPLSLFRTASSASNLYLADVQELLRHHLVSGFSQKAPSISLIQDSLSRLPMLCRRENKFDNNPELIKERNNVMSSAAKIMHGPDDRVYDIGREMENKLTLPGQSSQAKTQKKASL
jgi:hypothetical protein